jgi:NADH:ubiquinone oxidoreductase subunit 5 (subunit L)/multisubunit Na+/H+ antiporter MnhA subunit
MWIGSLALAGIGIPGVIGFAGFYSKDIILEAGQRYSSATRARLLVHALDTARVRLVR